MENSDLDLKPKKMIRFIASDGQEFETYGATQKRNSLLRLAEDMHTYFTVVAGNPPYSMSLANYLTERYTISKKKKR